jgi:hypothetical protein
MVPMEAMAPAITKAITKRTICWPVKRSMRDLAADSRGIKHSCVSGFLMVSLDSWRRRYQPFSRRERRAV